MTRDQITGMVPQSDTVLLAEDNAVNQLVAAGMLRSFGYRVRVVENGRDAVAAAVDTQFALILMDCQMPIMDGFAATQMIRAAEARGLLGTRRVPIVAVTASMTHDRQRCLNVGMDEHLSKPLQMDQLAATLLRFTQQGVFGETRTAIEPAHDEPSRLPRC